MKYKIYISNIFILILLIFYGCNYENPVNNNGYVHGKIFNTLNGFPSLYQGIALNSAPIIIPNAHGEFYFENVTIPYDLNTFFRFVPDDVTIFKNLTNRYPVLHCTEQMVSHHFKVIIKIKDNIWWKTTIARFISKSIFEHSYTNSKRIGSDLIITYEINSPITETTINGKFIILECTSSGSSNIISSINNYAEKSCTLRWNEIDTIIVERENFNFNPTESNVLIRIENNPHVYDSYTSIYIDFSDYYHNSKLYLNTYDTKQNSTYDFMVPESLPIEFKIRTENNSTLIQDSSYIISQKWIYLNPLEYGEIIYNSSFGLSYPVNSQENVDRNTKFLIYDEEPNGIYKFYIRDKNTYEDFEIFTDSKEIILPHLYDLGFTLLPNTEYKWYVEKYTNFKSIDDFVSSPYYERKESGSIIESERRKFRTSPNY